MSETPGLYYSGLDITLPLMETMIVEHSYFGPLSISSSQLYTVESH